MNMPRRKNSYKRDAAKIFQISRNKSEILTDQRKTLEHANLVNHDEVGAKAGLGLRATTIFMKIKFGKEFENLEAALHVFLKNACISYLHIC